MSLFEKLKNKRYDLQEAPIDDKGNITSGPGEIEKSISPTSCIRFCCLVEKNMD